MKKLIFLILFFNCSCSIKSNIDIELPTQEFYFPFYHVNEIIDENDMTVEYRLIPDTLSDFEVKELIEVLKGRNCEYLVTKENIVLIKSQCLFSVIDLSVIDQQFENRMRSVNQKIIYDSIMQNLND